MSYFKKLIVFGLGFLAIFSLAFGLGGNLKVEAAATAGYAVENCTNSSCGDNASCTSYEVTSDYLKTGINANPPVNKANSRAFCTTNKNSSTPTNWLIAGCNLKVSGDGTCTDNGIKYSNCTIYTNNILICDSKVSSSGTGTVTKSDNGYTCQLSENGNKVSLSCTKDGSSEKLSRSTPPCAAYKDKNANLNLTCKTEIIFFKNEATGSGDSSNTLINFPTGGGRVFLTKDGGTQYTGDYLSNNNAVNDVCTGGLERFLSVISINVGTSIARGVDGLVNQGYNCTARTDLKDFRAALVDKGIPEANDIVNPDDIKVNLQSQLKDCKSTDYKDLSDAQKTNAKKLDPAAKDGMMFEVCNNGTVVGKKNGDNVDTVDGSGNKINYNNSTGAVITNTTTNTGKSAADGAGNKLAEAFFDIVSAILLWFVYLLGWAATFVLYLLGLAILVFLRINPAGKDFFQVAVAPWSLLIGVTNLMILGSFIYVGFTYLLNLKKSNIQEFLQNVVIIAIALNFTILGSATVINITQGIGDVFIYSYAASKGGTSNENINSALMGSVINAIGRTSVLRCGKQVSDSKDAATTTATATTPSSTTSTECDITKNWPGQIGKVASVSISPITNLFGAKSGQATTAFVSETIFLIMICVAIYVFWKTTYMAVMRIIGLWMLMITSPLALAAYLSPIDSLKPLGKQWLDKFIKWSTFYPIFIFALVLVNLLTDKFALITGDDQFSLLNNGTTGTGPDQFTLMLRVILGAAISIGALYATTNFLDKDFETFAKNAVGAVGKWAKPLTGAYGAAGRVIGTNLGGLTGLTAGTLRGFNAIGSKGRIDNINKKLESKVLSDTYRADLIAKRDNLQNRRNIAKNRTAKYIERAERVGSFIPNLVEYAPYVAEGVSKIPSKIGEGFERLREGRAANFKESAYGKLEIALRKSSLGDNEEFINALDGDDDLSRFPGLTRNNILAAEAAAKEKSKKTHKLEDDAITIDLKDRVRDAKNKAMKVSGKKLNNVIAKAVIDDILTNFPENYTDWTENNHKSFEQLMNQSADDEGLARQLFSNDRAIKFAQQKFSTLDSNVQAKLAEKEPQLQGRQDDRYLAGQEFHTNPEKFKTASARAFKDDDIVRGYKDAGGDMAKLYEKTGQGYDLDSETAARATVKLAFEDQDNTLSAADAKVINPHVSRASRDVGRKFIAEDNLVREQVSLRKGEISWQNLDSSGTYNEALNNRIEQMRVASPVFAAQSQQDQERDARNALNAEKVNFDNLTTDQQVNLLNHLEKQQAKKEFGIDISNDNFIADIKKTTDLNILENTNVGLEAKAQIGTTEYESMTEAQRVAVLQRVTAEKAQAYKNSQAANSSRVAEASKGYYNGYKKGVKRAAIHSLAEDALAKYGKGKQQWQNDEMQQKVGAARAQNAIENAARLGNKTLDELLGSDDNRSRLSIDATKNNIFIDTSNEKQRGRYMANLSEAIADFHSKRYNSGADADFKQKVDQKFKDDFGIDLNANSQSIDVMGRPISNRDAMAEKFRNDGEKYINDNVIVAKKRPDGSFSPTDINIEQTVNRFNNYTSETEKLKDSKIQEEVGNSGAENLASKQSLIFGSKNKISY